MRKLLLFLLAAYLSYWTHKTLKPSIGGKRKILITALGQSAKVQETLISTFRSFWHYPFFPCQEQGKFASCEGIHPGSVQGCPGSGEEGLPEGDGHQWTPQVQLATTLLVHVGNCVCVCGATSHYVNENKTLVPSSHTHPHTHPWGLIHCPRVLIPGRDIGPPPPPFCSVHPFQVPHPWPGPLEQEPHLLPWEAQPLLHHSQGWLHLLVRTPPEGLEKDVVGMCVYSFMGVTKLTTPFYFLGVLNKY